LSREEFEEGLWLLKTLDPARACGLYDGCNGNKTSKERKGVYGTQRGPRDGPVLWTFGIQIVNGSPNLNCLILPSFLLLLLLLLLFKFSLTESQKKKKNGNYFAWNSISSDCRFWLNPLTLWHFVLKKMLGPAFQKKKKT
jgi:hypothetical protein